MNAVIHEERHYCGLQRETSVPEGAENATVDVNDPLDQQVEKMEQERLVLQLKEMVRDREKGLASKDAELAVSFIS